MRVIDVHTHPILIREAVEAERLLEAKQEVFGLGFPLQPLDTFIYEMEVACVEKAVLLPIDCSSSRGCKIFTNEAVAKLSQMHSQFLGFCSVDPHDRDSARKLEEAIRGLRLSGLKLAPGLQEFYPNDRSVYPIYEKACELDIPILFHAGMSWEPGSMSKYGHPFFLEDIAHDFPHLAIIIAHFAWPWVLETAALALKYPNVYMDTSALYSGTPREFIEWVFTQQLPISMIERSLSHQILFGSNYPRIEIRKMVKAIKALPLSGDTLDLIFYKNAEKLLKVG